MERQVPLTLTSQFALITLVNTATRAASSILILRRICHDDQSKLPYDDVDNSPEPLNEESGRF